MGDRRTVWHESVCVPRLVRAWSQADHAPPAPQGDMLDNSQSTHSHTATSTQLDSDSGAACQTGCEDVLHEGAATCMCCMTGWLHRCAACEAGCVHALHARPAAHVLRRAARRQVDSAHAITLGIRQRACAIRHHTVEEDQQGSCQVYMHFGYNAAVEDQQGSCQAGASQAAHAAIPARTSLYSLLQKTTGVAEQLARQPHRLASHTSTEYGWSNSPSGDKSLGPGPDTWPGPVPEPKRRRCRHTQYGNGHVLKQMWGRRRSHTRLPARDVACASSWPPEWKAQLRNDKRGSRPSCEVHNGHPPQGVGMVMR